MIEPADADAPIIWELSYFNKEPYRRRRLAEQTAKVDEVFLRRRALLQLRRPPLGDELAGRHRADREHGGT